MLTRIIRGTRSLNPLVALDKTLKYFSEIHPAVPKLAKKQHILKRLDTRKPREIFQAGFKPLGDNADHLKHLIDHKGGFVATTDSEEAMHKFAFGHGYAYLVVDPKQQGISAKNTLDDAMRSGHLHKLTSGAEEIESLYSEREISFREKGISPDQILMARRIIGIPVLAQAGLPGSVIYVGKPEFNYNSAYLQEYIKRLESDASSIDYTRLLRFTVGAGTLIFLGNILNSSTEEQQIVSETFLSTKNILNKLEKNPVTKALIAANENIFPVKDQKNKGAYIHFLKSAAKNMPLFLTAYASTERDNVMDIDTSLNIIKGPKK